MEPHFMNEGSFQKASATATSYNLAEIWQLPISGGVSAGESGGGLGLRIAHLGQLGDVSAVNRDFSANDQIRLEQRAGGGGSRKRRDADNESSKGVSTTSSGSGLNDSDGKRPKASASENEESKTEAEPSIVKPVEQNTNPPLQPPKQDYIHVRARRGQATDSHSLAERARREKISERMKILQELVPGCNKVVGKAMVLDEIINYVQSLQRQVEFLSMKLEAVNARMSPGNGIELFPSKDFDQQTYDSAGTAFGSQAKRDCSRGSSPEWLHMQVGGGLDRQNKLV